jgi:hypothetical protein
MYKAPPPAKKPARGNFLRRPPAHYPQFWALLVGGFFLLAMGLSDSSVYIQVFDTLMGASAILISVAELLPMSLARHSVWLRMLAIATFLLVLICMLVGMYVLLTGTYA